MSEENPISALVAEGMDWPSFEAELVLLATDGPEGVTALLQWLDAPPEYRAAIIQALAHSDDPRVLPALLEQFRRCFPRGSSRLHLAYGLLGVVFWLAYFYSHFPNCPDWLNALVIIGTGVALVHTWTSRARAGGDPSRALQEITAAIMQIAERHPSPEMSAILDDLGVVARDPFNHGKDARRTAREARTRLQELTDGTRHLPVISQNPPPEPETLPRPAFIGRE